MAAREFGSQPDRWQKNRAELLRDGWLEKEDLEWQPDLDLKPKDLEPQDLAQKFEATEAWKEEKNRAWERIIAEIEQLRQLMEDDREEYLAEIDVQADGLAGYFYSMLGMSAARRPWTVEYINCGLALGNIAYMHYKDRFKRVRPSLLCPGLVPAFGPPGHPSFPSGHSFLGHLISLLLLEIPAICQRYGHFTGNDGSPGKATDPDPPLPKDAPAEILRRNPLHGRGELRSPLLWLSQRLAKNRERLGVHYASDSMGSRHLAAARFPATRKAAHSPRAPP
jgi:membrane-associated phospholipid phosphatase